MPHWMDNPTQSAPYATKDELAAVSRGAVDGIAAVRQDFEDLNKGATSAYNGLAAQIDKLKEEVAALHDLVEDLTKPATHPAPATAATQGEHDPA